MDVLANKQALIKVLCLNTTVLASQVLIAMYSASLTVAGDAFHALSDVIALSIALSATMMLSKKPSEKWTFGLYKAEFLMTIINCLIIFTSAIFILCKAVERITSGANMAPNGELMMVAAGIGMAANALSVKIMHANTGSSLLMKSAYLEVMADFVSSLTLMVAGIITKLYGVWWIDILCAVLIGVWIVARSYHLLRQTLSFVLDAVPHHINLQAVQNAILAIDAVQSLHQLHIWSIHEEQVSLSVHLVVKPEHGHQATRQAVEKMLIQDFHINYLTIQTEKEDQALH